MSIRPSGDGAIYWDRSRKRWVGALVVGWEGQTPIRRKVSAKTRPEAARKLRVLREQHAAHQLPTDRAPTLAQWMDVWMRDIAAHRVRPSTFAGYASKVSCIVELIGKHRLDRLRPEHVEQAWRHLADVGNPLLDEPRPFAPASILQCHRILSRALKVAQQRGYAARNVCTMIDAPSAQSPEMKLLTAAEARTVLAGVAGRRNAARWSVALALGLRQGEALGLRWQDVDLDDGVLRVRQALSRITGRGLVVGDLKSRAARRDIALPASLLAALREHRRAQNAERLRAGDFWQDHGLVFTGEAGQPIDPSRDWAAWRDLLVELGLPHRRLHDARHTAATLLLAQGVPTRVVMGMLGHSQISVTARYQHVVDDMVRDAAARMDDALWGPATG